MLYLANGYKRYTLYISVVFKSAIFPSKQTAIFISKGGVKVTSALIKTTEHQSTIQTYTDEVHGMNGAHSRLLSVEKEMHFPWLSMISAAVTVPLKASDWPSIACGSWLGCVLGREGMKCCRKRGDKGREASRCRGGANKERENRQRASQNTKCLNFNTLLNSRAPKHTHSSHFSNCSQTGLRKNRCLSKKACEKLVALQLKSRSSWYGRLASTKFQSE